MKVALVVNQATSNLEENLQAMMSWAHQAVDSQADLVLFPEAAMTGLVNNDKPEHDLPLGQPIPGPVTEKLGTLARRRSFYLATGLLEQEGRCSYDAAVLINPNGNLRLKYRRIQPQWHGRDADPNVYRQGNQVQVASTRWGVLAFALCGDLFDDGIVTQVREENPDYLLWSVARNFSDGSFDQGQWEREEEPQYVTRATLIGCTTLMVNLIEDPEWEEYPSFGGAMVVSAEGEVGVRFPLGIPGILYAEV